MFFTPILNSIFVHIKLIHKTIFVFFLMVALFPQSGRADNPDSGQIRNVIVMIPDGCGSEWLSIGRWLNDGAPLHLDSIIRGMVRSYCSDSPIGDSAPTGSCYATGHRSQDGFIATYPARSMTPDGTRFDVPDSLAYRPMMTLLETAKLQGRATALVFTCFFPHATPASFAAHTPKRNEYFRIAKQMTVNPCDVLLGGGSLYVDSALSRYDFAARKCLKDNGILYTKSFAEVQKEVAAGRQKIWGLFAPNDLEFEIDRRHTDQPSLEEMTRTALKVVGKNPKGFFMMVEGSKIDWGAHDNDLPGAVFDFLAFDRAVGVAMDFAKKDGHTLVVVMPDHQTGGVSLGNSNHNKGYASLSHHEIFGKISHFNKSVDKAVRDIVTATKSLKKEKKGDYIWLLTGSSLRNEFQIDYIPDEEVKYLAGVIKRNGTGDSSVRTFAHIVNHYTSIGWTTHGHNGGDVFLAVYHPDETRILQGMVDNEEIAPYICREAGLPDLDSLSRLYFAPLNKVFEGKKISIKGLDESRPDRDPDCVKIKDVFMDGKKGILTLYPNSTHALFGNKEIELPGPCIYNGKDFYLPATF